VSKIRWSPEAFERVKSIKEYIEQESSAGAYEFAEGVLAQIENIALFPKIGKSAFSETYPNLRILVWKHYKIYYEYREDEDIVEIWGVWDARSMMPTHKG
jgi:plasmid stabilization system protein ParE